MATPIEGSDKIQCCQQQGPFSAPEQMTLLFLHCLAHSFIVLFLSWDKKETEKLQE
jgi:hypothetical protein